MLSALKVIDRFGKRGAGPYIGVPCSFLKPLIDCLIDQRPGQYLAVNNEGEAVAAASGAYLAGARPVVMFQNSGLGNAVNPLTSLNHVLRIPLLLIITWRGEPGQTDEPQHQLMGGITKTLLDLMQIPYSNFPEDLEELERSLDTAMQIMDRRRTSYALIMRRETLAPYELRTHTSVEAQPAEAELNTEAVAGELIHRRTAISAIVRSAGADTLLIATTGKTARELCEDHDRDTNLYVVGSMGCASSIALGLALGKPERKVMILDGDGAALMRLESMASIGHYAPKNLTHIILDNQAYDSTGGQQTLSPTVNFSHLALSCGYRTAWSSMNPDCLAQQVAASLESDGPHLVHFRVRTGSRSDLGRPHLTPEMVADRFRKTIVGATPVTFVLLS